MKINLTEVSQSIVAMPINSSTVDEFKDELFILLNQKQQKNMVKVYFENPFEASICKDEKEEIKKRWMEFEKKIVEQLENEFVKNELSCIEKKDKKIDYKIGMIWILSLFFTAMTWNEENDFGLIESGFYFVFNVFLSVSILAALLDTKNNNIWQENLTVRYWRPIYLAKRTEIDKNRIIAEFIENVRPDFIKRKENENRD